MENGKRVKPGEWAVGAFALFYTGAFAIWFFSIGNYEFIVYIVTMAVLAALIASSLRVAEYPGAILWALAIWGLLHMAGGGVPVGGSVLYSYQLVPLVNRGDLILLKYDQVVHAYGFAVTAWLLWHLMAYHYPLLRRTWTIYVFAALASMGLGAVNEIIEFSAVVTVPDTNVGGYTNTALDLVFNAAGAVLAMIWVAARERRVAGVP